MENMIILPVTGEKQICIRTAEEMQYSPVDADAVFRSGDTEYFLYREPMPDMVSELHCVLDCILSFEPVSPNLIGNIGELLYDPYYIYKEDDLRKYSFISGVSNSLFLYPVSRDSFMLELTAGSYCDDIPFQRIGTDTVSRESVSKWKRNLDTYTEGKYYDDLFG